MLVALRPGGVSGFWARVSSMKAHRAGSVRGLPCSQAAGAPGRRLRAGGHLNPAAAEEGPGAPGPPQPARRSRVRLRWALDTVHKRGRTEHRQRFLVFVAPFPRKHFFCLIL